MPTAGRSRPWRRRRGIDFGRPACRRVMSTLECLVQWFATSQASPAELPLPDEERCRARVPLVGSGRLRFPARTASRTADASSVPARVVHCDAVLGEHPLREDLTAFLAKGGSLRELSVGHAAAAAGPILTPTLRRDRLTVPYTVATVAETPAAHTQGQPSPGSAPRAPSWDRRPCRGAGVDGRRRPCNRDARALAAAQPPTPRRSSGRLRAARVD